MIPKITFLSTQTLPRDYFLLFSKQFHGLTRSVQAVCLSNLAQGLLINNPSFPISFAPKSHEEIEHQGTFGEFHLRAGEFHFRAVALRRSLQGCKRLTPMRL